MATREAWVQRALVAGLLGLIAAVYWPAMTGGFVFDDFPNLVNNAALRVDFGDGPSRWLQAMFSSPASALQRPLAMLTFALNHAAAGLDPFWFKVTNLFVHLANTLLVYALCRRLLQAAGRSADPTALWITAAWALNPINLTAVLFVVQRMESLCHTFVFAGLCLYLAGRARLKTGRNRSGWLLVVLGLVGCTSLGVSVKESAALLPLYAFAIEWALLGWTGSDGRRDLRLVGSFGLVLVLPAILGLAWLLPSVASGAAFAGRSFTAAERLLTESRVVVDYFAWTMLPQRARMGLYHDDFVVSQGLLSPPSTLASLLLLALLLVAAVAIRRRRPLFSLGIAWFLSAQLLTATVVPLELMFEHRNYFASLGLCLALGDLLWMASQHVPRRVGSAIAVFLILLYGGMTALRAQDWSDPMRFSLVEKAHHPTSPRAAYDVARNYVMLTGYRADSRFLAPAFKSLDDAMQLADASPLPASTAIVLAARTGRPTDPKWWADLEQRLRRNPIGPQETAAVAALVQCEIDRQCRFPRARMMAVFAAAQRRPPMAEMLNIQGNYTLNILGDAPAALAFWLEAARSAPSTVEYQSSVARLLIAMGRGDEALPFINRIRAMGRLGQYDVEANRIERLARGTPSTGSGQ